MDRGSFRKEFYRESAPYRKHIGQSFGEIDESDAERYMEELVDVVDSYCEVSDLNLERSGSYGDRKKIWFETQETDKNAKSVLSGNAEYWEGKPMNYGAPWPRSPDKIRFFLSYSAEDGKDEFHALEDILEDETVLSTDPSLL